MLSQGKYKAFSNGRTSEGMQKKSHGCDGRIMRIKKENVKRECPNPGNKLLFSRRF